ncbi:MAG TPA: M48 family metallopeptidase [Thermoanaerobaculia bacterium]|nr:M48 family metallopeptidase [Thermoanaerobaculia bacterium]
MQHTHVSWFRIPRRASVRWRLAGMAALALVCTLSQACATLGGGGGFNLLSLEQEWQLGQQLAQDVAKQVRLSRDRAVNDYVSSMGQRLVRHTELGHLPWEFHVIEDPAINAFNMPGGHVYVHTGLIAAAGNASELAAVMAHEISHGVSRHGTENLTRAYGASMLASLLLGEDAKTHERLAAEILAGGALAKFSRDAEREADRLGMRTMYQAGYDPRGMVGIFETLLEQRKRRPNAVASLFSSHPLTEARIAEARQMASELPRKTSLVTNDGRLPAVQQRVGR